MFVFSPVATLAAFSFASSAMAVAVWTTPHDSYSSSVGVLGCKINTNRVAYWPSAIDCNNICVKLTYATRSVHLLRIDQSGGAHDISYDAWNYLQTGESAAVSPIAGGLVAMEYEDVDASECAGLIHTADSKLPLSAPNSINFLASCLSQPDSWVAQNYLMYNICDPICTLGYDEQCSFDMTVSNQPSCPHTLGLQTQISSTPVFNIEYLSGHVVIAGSGQGVSVSAMNAVDSIQNSPASDEISSPDPVSRPSPSPYQSLSPSSSPGPSLSSVSQITQRPMPSLTGGAFVERTSTSASTPERSSSSSALQHNTFTPSIESSTATLAVKVYVSHTIVATSASQQTPYEATLVSTSSAPDSTTKLVSGFRNGTTTADQDAVNPTAGRTTSWAFTTLTIATSSSSREAAVVTPVGVAIVTTSAGSIETTMPVSIFSLLTSLLIYSIFSR